MSLYNYQIMSFGTNRYFGPTTSVDLRGLTEHQVQQIENLENLTVSNQNWSYLTSINQSLSTGSNATFNKVVLVNGSSAAPALSFTNDPNTGIYSTGVSGEIGISSDNVLGLLITNSEVRIPNTPLKVYNNLVVTNGLTEAMKVHYSTNETVFGGNVGIKKAVGTSALEVSGDILTTGTFTILDTLRQTKLSFEVYGGSNLIADRKIYYGDQDVNLLLIPTQYVNSNASPQFAKIGINQAAGTEVCEVNGNIKCKGSLKVAYQSFATSISPSSLSTNRSLTLPDVDLTLTQYSGPDQALNALSTPRFTRLGIAQSAGTEALEVAGNIYANISLNSDAFGLSLFNTGLNADGKTYSMRFGKEFSDNNIEFIGHCNKTTSTNNYGYLVQFGNNISTAPCVSWKYSSAGAPARVGISQPPGTEALEVTGKIKTTVGMLLPTSNGTASTLDFYEQGNFPATFTGPWANQTVTIYFTRIGNVVTLFISSRTLQATNSAVTAACANVIPARLHRAGGGSFICKIVDATIHKAGAIVINDGTSSTGSIVIGNLGTAGGSDPNPYSANILHTGWTSILLTYTLST